VNVPIEYHTLPNGLKVVLSRDTSSPTAIVGVYYGTSGRTRSSGSSSRTAAR
jgi:hypothetical protein